MLNRYGNFRTKRELERKYNMEIKQMNCNSIVHVIPPKWLKCTKGMSIEINKIQSEKKYVRNRAKNIEEITCKDIYWNYIGRISMSSTAEQKWDKYANTDTIHWQDHYVIPFNICRETHLQSFQ